MCRMQLTTVRPPSTIAVIARPLPRWARRDVRRIAPIARTTATTATMKAGRFAPTPPATLPTYSLLRAPAEMANTRPTMDSTKAVMLRPSVDRDAEGRGGMPGGYGPGGGAPWYGG